MNHIAEQESGYCNKFQKTGIERGGHRKTSVLRYNNNHFFEIHVVFRETVCYNVPVKSVLLCRSATRVND